MRTGDRIVWLAAALLGACTATPVIAENKDEQAGTPEAIAPAGAQGLRVQWVDVTVPNLGVLPMAVARPSGTGPFPTVLLLHGSHGFAREYVQLALALADKGQLAVAACWFTGGGGAGSRFVTPIACPQGPAMPAASSDMALKTVAALVQAVRALPDAAPSQVALFGHSRGGGAVLNYVLQTGDARAAMLNSTGYPAELSALADQIAVPILILHGTEDSAADGGSSYTSVAVARNFAAALRTAGKTVETVYYEGSGHNGIFSSATQFDDEVRRIAAFLENR